jgi:hypothetical protein
MAHALPCCSSLGGVVCFERVGEERHGNFFPASYRAILANAEWRRRLGKVHTSGRNLPASEHGRRSELDSCMSSDALLMNVFCHPRTMRSSAVTRMLGLSRGSTVRFGVRARVPLLNRKFDQTEIDMQIGDLLVEAKLTESDFQRAERTRLELYRDFEMVFDRRSLPRAGEHYGSYQLIRNVLAAYDRGSDFCVLLDARRADLMEAWYAVMRCVQSAELRTRCKVLTWQELSGVLPGTLRRFLGEKYGIEG